MNPLKGIVFKLLATFSFTLMSALVRHIGEAAPVGQVVFSRSSFAIAPLLVWLAWRGELTTAMRTRDPLSHFVRGLTGVASMFFFFTGLALLPLAESIAIGFAMPLMSVVFAAIFLKENVRIYRWTAVGVGLLGVLVMLWPRLGRADFTTDAATIGAVSTLIGATLSGAAVVQIRRLTRTETTGSIVFYFSVFTTLAGAATLPFGWIWPAPELAVALVATGLLGGMGQILMTQSYRHADASLVAPFDYASMIWALAIGWLAFREVPSALVLAGAAVVIAAGLFVIWREHQLGLERAREREITPPK